jgi:uncharacterized coiled-coil DUF342 family protein
MSRSSHEISLEIAEKEKSINSACSNRDQVKLAINEKRRQIDKLRFEIRSLEDSLIRAETVVRELKTEHSILRDQFWSAKDGGI